jgi:DNA-binding CsgD family transcriptional regulator/PAS domain-containing protein
VGIEEVRASWRRSFNEHRVDPDSRQAPSILTAQELSISRTPVEELIRLAREDNDRLYAIVGRVGYALLFTSADGVVVDVRGDPCRVGEFQHWGIWQGGVWSERVEGTNGIGTSIAEQRPITIHRSQHFRARHATLSCCGAPVFGPSSELVAVVDVSSCEPELSDRSHALALAVTIDTARAIEERLFRFTFRGAWILAIAVPASVQPALLLAMDDDQRIVGADRRARETFGLDRTLLEAGTSLWRYFHGSPSLFSFRAGDKGAHLRRLGDSALWQALITPPQENLTARLAPFHTRPRMWCGGPDALATADGSSGERVPVSSRPRRVTALSPRERSVLELVADGRSNKEIARLLVISPETVKSHLEHLFAKLAVQRRTQAISLAKDLGLVP